MLRRISRNPDGGVRSSLSGAILPGCASLVVPLLAVTALELPAAAIDRIAAPLLGRSADGASLFRPPAATSAHGSSYGADGTYRAPDQLVARDHGSSGHLVAPSASSTAAARCARAAEPMGRAAAVAVSRRGSRTGATRPWIRRTQTLPTRTAIQAAARQAPARALRQVVRDHRPDRARAGSS